jgi:hypothetical protein
MQPRCNTARTNKKHTPYGYCELSDRRTSAPAGLRQRCDPRAARVKPFSVDHDSIRARPHSRAALSIVSIVPEHMVCVYRWKIIGISSRAYQVAASRVIIFCRQPYVFRPVGGAGHSQCTNHKSTPCCPFAPLIKPEHACGSW